MDRFATLRLGLRCWCVLCALTLAGCANFRLPRIDPSGERFFVVDPPPAAPVVVSPGAPVVAAPVPILTGPGSAWGLTVTPSQLIAPVGSEVVLVASVCGNNGYLLTLQRVDWMLAPDSPGQIMKFGQRNWYDVLSLARGLPQNYGNRYVINSTLLRGATIERGSPSPLDDLVVQPGQAWVAVTSYQEGTSHVTALAPSIYGLERRQQTASIHWIDAQWRFPPPAIGTPGSRLTLTTAIKRLTNSAPLTGWQVRYTIAAGPEARFASEGASIAEATTNAAGEASVEIFQQQPTQGTNQVNIEVLSPNSTVGQAPLVAGSGTTHVTWSASEPAGGTLSPDYAAPGLIAPPPTATPAREPAPSSPPSTAPQATAPQATGAPIAVQVLGPDTAEVGTDAKFEIRVTNQSAQQVSGLVVTDHFDAGLQHAVSASPIERDLGPLAPGATQTIGVVLRVTQPGRQCQTIAVRNSTGVNVSTQKCLTATGAALAPAPAATSGGLTVQKSGPERKRVGEIAEFSIVVVNNGDQAIANLRIEDNYDAMLEPTDATEGFELTGGVLVWKVESLAPGRSVLRRVNCRCLREASRACNRVRVTATSVDPISDEACLEIVSANAAATPAQPPPATAPSPPRTVSGRLSLSVADQVDPVAVGEQETYQIVVTNESQASIMQVQLTVAMPPEMKVVRFAGQVRATVTPTGLNFVPIAELRAGESLTFEVYAQATTQGTAEVRATVAGQGLEPVTEKASTQIVGQR